jgi:hypothetical protein
MTDRATRGGYLYASDGTRLNEADNLKNSTDFTGARIVMGEIHAFIHRGIVFDLSRKITVPAESSLYLTGQTNGKSVHFHRESYTANAGGLEFRLLENVTSTGGDQLTPLNRNRLSTNTATIEIFAGSNVTNTGNELYLIGFPASSTPVSGGAQAGGETQEWILKPDTTYAIEIKNLSNAERIVYADLSWYEV